MLPLPLVRRADWLAAHFCYDLVQRYRRSILTRSLQYPNVHIPDKIPRLNSSADVAPVSFPSVDIHIVIKIIGTPLLIIKGGWHVTGLGYRGLSSEING